METIQESKFCKTLFLGILLGEGSNVQHST